MRNMNKWFSALIGFWVGMIVCCLMLTDSAPKKTEEDLFQIDLRKFDAQEAIVTMPSAVWPSFLEVSRNVCTNCHPKLWDGK